MTKKFLKQLINFLLVLSIVFQSGFFVYGEEEIQEEEIQETLEEAIEETEIQEEKPVEETVEEEPCFYLNPAWAPFFTEEQVKALIEENREVIAPSIYGKQHNIAVPQFHNIEDAVEAIRNAMINRVASIRIHVNFPYDKGKSAIWQDIYAQANAELNEYQKVIVLGVGGLNGTVDTGTGNVKGYLTFRFAHYFNTNEQEEEFETVLQQTMDQLNIYEASDYDKVLAIYNFITANTSYDREHVDDDTYLLKHSAYAALINHTAVCQGFALLFYRMATAAGLNAHYLIGTGNGVGHAWNSVEIDGTYYLLDSTWDETADGDASLYRWFLKGTNNFQYHELDASYRPYEGNYSPTDYASEPFTDYIPVTEIQLTPEEETVYPEETIHIVPTVLPSNATNKQLTFTSSNEEVATVDYLGRVTTIAPGETTITVTCEDGITAEALITVVAKDEYIYIETYSYSKSILVLFNETNTKKITVKLVPENVTDPTITWLSKDTSIANVDEDGNVTGVRPGQVDIIVSPNGASNKVFPSATTKAHIIGVALNEESVTVNQGDTYFFENLYAYPGVDGTGSITWKSSDESIATVDENGVITGISGGDCTISATTYNETNTASIPVHVNEYPTSVSLNKTELTLETNQSQTLQATIKEASANIGLDLTWSSSDSEIATVDHAGKITAKKPGEATITVSTENGKSASCKVLIPTPEKVTIDKGKTYFFEKIYEYIDIGDDERIIWKSSDESIATVDENGVITGMMGGDCMIKASIDTETTTVPIPVHVNEYPTSISLNKTELTLETNQSQTLQTTIKETSANIGLGLTWSSSDSAVATVDQNGKITAKKPGEATITVSTENGKSANCKVLIPTPEKVTIDKGKTYFFEKIYEYIDVEDIERIIWKSSDENIATVDEHGVITGVSGGDCMITASTDTETTTVPIPVHVNEYPTSISLNKTELTLKVNQSQTLQATIKEASANISLGLTWSSSDSAVATVDQNGKITAKNPGEATITVSTENGKSANCKVLIPTPKKITIDKGKTYFFEKIYEYIDIGDDERIIWKSSDESIATVDENGVITGMMGGDCMIKASIDTETTTVPIPIHVNEYPTSVSLNKTELTLKVNQSQTLQATIKEASANIGLDLTWSSSDTGIVTVDQKGKITAKKPGEATITVSTENGKQASCLVNVPVPVVPLVAAYNSVKGIDFRWKAVNGATGYDIWRKNQGKWTKIASLNGGNITQYYDEEVKDLYGKIYVYSVAARVNNLVGPYDEKGRGICRLQPPTLTSVQNGVNTNAYVEWTFGDKSSGYEVQFSNTLDFKSYTKVQVEGRNILHTLINGFLPGKYYFRVRSYMTDVNNITYYSQYSNVRSLQKIEGIPIVQLTGVYNSVNGIDLRWKKVPGATGYDIWRKNRGVWTKIDAITDGEIVQIYDTEVKEEYGRIYVYSVAARVDDQVGAYNEKGRGICRLKPPVLLDVSDMDNQVLVTWSLGEKASGYEVQVSETLDFKVKEVYLVEGRDTLSMHLSNLEEGKKYYIRVRSYMTDQNQITYYSQYTSVKTIVR